MAIFDFLPGFEVTVNVDGEPLKEYNDNEDEIIPGEVGKYQASKTVAKYIELVTGKGFTIKLSVGHPYKMRDHLSFTIMADGVCIDRFLLLKQTYNIRGSWKEIVTGFTCKVAGRTSEKPLKFAAIQICKHN